MFLFIVWTTRFSHLKTHHFVLPLCVCDCVCRNLFELELVFAHRGFYPRDRQPVSCALQLRVYSRVKCVAQHWAHARNAKAERLGDLAWVCAVGLRCGMVGVQGSRWGLACRGLQGGVTSLFRARAMTLSDSKIYRHQGQQAVLVIVGVDTGSPQASAGSVGRRFMLDRRRESGREWPGCRERDRGW